MKKEALIDAMGRIDDSIIESVREAEIKPLPRKKAWIKYAAVAACAAIALTSGFAIKNKSENSLPPLELPETINASMGTGEIYWAENALQLVNANPYNKDEEIKTLPVFENTVVYDGDGGFIGADTKKMNDFLQTVLARFDTDAAAEISVDLPGEFFAQTPDASINITQVMNAVISFNSPQPLPKEYSLGKNAAESDYKKAAEYLKEKYAGLIAMQQPQINISGGDYNIYGEQLYSIEFYEGTGDTEEKIINYNFRRVTFNFNEKGEVTGAVISAPDLTKKLGDYPVISEEKAENQLKSGNYITTLSREIKADDKIAKTELIYRNDSTEKAYMPYYKIFVELQEENAPRGLTAYGVYYVPAVKALAK